MNITLSDLANYAQIASIPLMIFTWLVTRERFAKFWKKWLLRILAIVFILGLIGLLRIGWLEWLEYQVILPFWAVIIISLTGLIILSLIKFIIAFSKNSHDNYISDNIFEIEWRWNYQKGKLYEYNLVPFCPEKKCSCQLDPVRRSQYHLIDDIVLICDHCGFKKEFTCNWEQLKWKVCKEIDRRIRTGEFRK